MTQATSTASRGRRQAFGALRHPNFRTFWFSLVSNFLGAPFAVAIGRVAVIAYIVRAVVRPGFRRRVNDAASEPAPASVDAS